MTDTTADTREHLRLMALSLATGSALVEPRAFDAAIDAHRAAVLREAADAINAAFTGPDLDRYTRYGADLLRRMADEAQPAHVCKPNASVYYCPASGQTESDCHGGFDTCCDRPDLHQPATAVQQDEAQPEPAPCSFPPCQHPQDCRHGCRAAADALAAEAQQDGVQR